MSRSSRLGEPITPPSSNDPWDLNISSQFSVPSPAVEKLVRTPRTPAPALIAFPHPATSLSESSAACREDTQSDTWKCPKEVSVRVHDDSPSKKAATTPRDVRIVDGVLSFAWLLAELDQAHKRELQEAIATSSMQVSAQGQSGPNYTRTECDGPPHLQKPLQSTVESFVTAQCPPSSSKALDLTSTVHESPGNNFEPKKVDWQCREGEHRSSHMSSIVTRDGTVGQKSSYPVKPLSTVALSPKRLLDSLQRNGMSESFGPQGEDQSYRGRLTRMLNDTKFECAVAVAVAINALIMCAECQYAGMDVGHKIRFPGRAVKASAIWPGAEMVFFISDWFFGTLYCVELLVKLACLHIKFIYNSQDWDWKLAGWHPQDWRFPFARLLGSLQYWNMLDSLIVLAFLSSKLVASSSDINPQMFRILRLVRIARLVKLLRFFETLDHLYIMITAISGLSHVLAWAILLLTTMLLTCDLILAQFLQATYFNNVTASDLSDAQLKKHHQMYEYFGTSSRCLLTMFEVTLGNWPPVARLLTEEVSDWFIVPCLLHKLTIGFSVIGVITGIILQETFKVAQQDDIILFRQKERTAKALRRKMKAFFGALDTVRDGRISLSEFVAIGESPEMKTWLSSLEIETDDLQTLFELIDWDGGGYITADELTSRMPRIRGVARGIDMLTVKKMVGAAPHGE